MEYQFIFLDTKGAARRLLAFKAPDDTTAIRYASRYCIEADVPLEVRWCGAQIVLLTPMIARLYLAVTN